MAVPEHDILRGPGLTRPPGLEEVPGGLLVTDREGYIRYASQTFLDWLGYEPTSLLGKKRFSDLLTIGGKLYHETHHAVLLELQGEVRELAYDLKDTKGGRHSVVVNARRRPGDEYVYLIFPFPDRKKYEDELKTARKRAEAADLAKETFLSTMSHEIRNPLHAVLEAGRWLKAENPRADQLELIGALETAGHNLLRMVNDVLDVSKLHAEKFSLSEAPFELADQLRQLDLVYAPLCRQKGIVWNIESRVPDDLRLQGDGMRLGQVLTNLVSNAVKFTAAGSVVLRVSGEDVPEERYRLTFTVRDTGPGIPADRQKQVFEAFTQSDQSTYLQHGGSGLGLTIADGIVRAFAGQLSLVSEVGTGSTFTVTLTLPRIEPVERKDAVVPDKLAPLSHLTVLDVDDSAVNRLVNARYFRRWGIQYVQATNGAEALELLEKTPVDFALADLQMPEMDGYQFARAVRSHPDAHIRQIPLIAVSASQTTDLSEPMAAAGYDALVNKPFDAVYLYQTIARLSNKQVDFTDVDELFTDDPEERRAFLDLASVDLLLLADAAEAVSAATNIKAEEAATRELERQVHACAMILGYYQLGPEMERLRLICRQEIGPWWGDVLARRLRRLVH